MSVAFQGAHAHWNEKRSFAELPCFACHLCEEVLLAGVPIVLTKACFCSLASLSSAGFGIYGIQSGKYFNCLSV